MQRRATEDADETTDKAEDPETPAAPPDRLENNAETQRRSRKLLAATTSTPAWLLSMFPLGPEVTLIHIQHRDKQLPHFQCRFTDGSKHGGKTPGVH